MSRSGRAVASALVMMVIGLAANPAAAAAATPASGQVSAASAYTPLPPVRVLDTRNSNQTLAGWGALDLPLAGGLVPTAASAVVLNVTVTDTAASGFLSIYPAGAWSGTSSLNFNTGGTVANLVVVEVGLGGDITAFNGSAGTSDVVIDLEGYFSPPEGTSAGQYVSLAPARIADTRPGSGLYAGQTMGSGGRLDIQAAGAGGIPSAGVSAVIVNLTVTDTTESGYLSAWAQGANQPLASTLNWGEGETVSNQAIVQLNSGGRIAFFNSSGSTDVVVDVVGYFTDVTASVGAGGYFTAIAPVRLLDTRISGQTLLGASDLSVQVAGMAGVAPTATVALLNVTVTDTSAAGYLVAYPGISPTATSNLNWAPGQTVANLATVGLSAAGSLTIHNSSGDSDVIVDAFGYFSGPAPQVSLSISPSTLIMGSSSPASVSIAVSSKSGPLANDPVNLTSTGTCGQLTPAATSTDINGLATASYTAALNGGTCLITAKESQDGVSATAAVVQISAPATVALSLGTNPLLANGSSTSAVLVSVTDSKANSVVGDSIYVTAVGDCGSLSPAAGVTGPGGHLAVTYVASTTAGFCSLAATESGGGSASAELIQTQSPPAADSLALSPNPASVAGLGGLTLTAKVTGTAATQDPVLFTVTPKSCGALNPSSSATGSNGAVSVFFTAISSAAVCTVTALEANGGATASDDIYQQSASNSITVSASPSSIQGSGQTSSTILVTVTSPSASPVSETLTVSLTGTCGTLNPASPYATGSSGQLTVSYTSAAQSGSCMLTFADSGTPPGSGHVLVTQT